MKKLSLYMRVSSTEALGPYKRYALWTQGCKKRCPGCISPDAQTMQGGTLVPISILSSEIINTADIEGITISGGEPFLQQDALCELIDQVRQHRDIGVIVYTGMLYSELANTPLLQRCDLLVDGEYIKELNDDKSLRGSSNQNVICITERYSKIIDQFYGRAGRKMEFVQKDGSLTMVGIPSKGIANALCGGDVTK